MRNGTRLGTLNENYLHAVYKVYEQSASRGKVCFCSSISCVSTSNVSRIDIDKKVKFSKVNL